MIIVIGSDGSKLDDQVSKRFGHATFYLIYDTEKNHLEAVQNNDEDHSHKQLTELLIKGAQAFIVGNIGPHAFEILKEGNAKVYLARKTSGKDAVEKLLKGELKELTEPTVKQSINHS